MSTTRRLSTFPASASVAWSLAIRYLKTRRKQFAAFITWVSLLGLALGVLVLTVVVSVMNGFDRELKTRILGTVPHVLIEGIGGADPRLADVAALDGVENAYEFFLGAGMLTRSGAVNPVAIYGIDPTDGTALSSVASSMREGALADLAGPGQGIVMGAPLASRLGLFVGDTIALVISEPSAAGLRPIMQPYRLAGTFELGAELDYSLVVIDRADLAVADPATVGRSGVRLVLADPLLAESIARQAVQSHPDLAVSSWADSYGELFQAVRLEKLMMFLILLMVVAVATFNIVSGQMMVVADKRPDIAILRTMGAEAGTIRLTFLFQGVLISGDRHPCRAGTRRAGRLPDHGHRCLDEGLVRVRSAGWHLLRRGTGAGPGLGSLGDCLSVRRALPAFRLAACTPGGAHESRRRAARIARRSRQRLITCSRQLTRTSTKPVTPATQPQSREPKISG